MLFGVAAGAAPPDPAGENGALVVESPDSPQILLQVDDKPPETKEAIPAGTYILPDAPGKDTKGKTCMTVCALWGEDCILISQGTGGEHGGNGGYKRRCRHTCKQFSEECF